MFEADTWINNGWEKRSYDPKTILNGIPIASPDGATSGQVDNDRTKGIPPKKEEF